MKSVGALGAFASSFVVVVTVIAQTVGSAPVSTVRGTPSSGVASAVLGSKAPPVLPVLGSQPWGESQIDVRLPAFTSALAAQQLGDEYGMQLVSYWPSFGTYRYDLPTIDVSPGPSGDTALVMFPPRATLEQISGYLRDNGLTIGSWVRAGKLGTDPVGDRVLLVRLPQIKPQPLDLEHGMWQAKLPLHLSPRAVSDWAAANGLQFVSYDPSTGVLVIRGPAIVRTPTSVKPVTVTRRIVQSQPAPAPPATSTPVPTQVALYAGFAPSTRLGQAQAAVQQAGALLVSFDAAAELATVSMTSDRVSLTQTLLSGQAGVVCVNTVAARCSSAAAPADLVALAAPAGLALSADGITLTWTAVSGASAYIVFRATDPAGPYVMVTRVAGSANPLFTDTSAPAGVDYYRVQSVQTCTGAMQTACDVATAAFDPAYATAPISVTVTAPVPATPPAQAPAPVAASPSMTAPQAASIDGHVEVSWDSVAGATSYQVYRGDTMVGTTTATDFIDVGGTPGTDYQYTVLAVIPGTTTAASAPATIHWQPASSQPVVLRLSPQDTSLVGTVRFAADVRSGDGAGQVAWQLSGPRATVNLGAAPGTGLAGDPLSWSSAVTFDTTTIPDGAYTLTGTVTDVSGNVTSVTRTVTVSNAAPISPVAFGAATTGTGVALTWQQAPNSGAALYRISRDGQKLVELTPEIRSYVDGSAGAGPHSYSIVLVDRSGAASAPANATVSVAAAPTQSSITLRVLLPGGSAIAPGGLAGGYLLLSAQALNTTTPLKFEFAPASGSWFEVPAATSCAAACTTDWNVAGLTPGAYRVRSVGQDAALVSNEVSFVVSETRALPAPTTLAVAPVSSGVSVYWTPPAALSPAGYLLSRQTADGWSPIAVSSGTSYVDSEPSTDQPNTYRVQAVDSDGNVGVASSSPAIALAGRIAPATSAPIPAAPGGLRAISGAGGVTLVWSAVHGATGYQVERAIQAGGPFQLVATTASPIFVDLASRLGGQGYYRVRAIGAGVLGAPSSIVSALIVPAPQVEVSGAVVIGTGPAPTRPVGDILVLGPAQATPARTGASLEVQASGSALSASEVRLETLTGTTWWPLLRMPANANAGGWSAAGSVSTEGLAAGEHVMRAVALGVNGSVLEVSATARVEVVREVATPSGVAASISGSAVHVTWTPPAATYPVTYDLFRSVSGGGLTPVGTGLRAASFDDNNLAGGASVTYVVVSVDDVGNRSAWSSPATVATPAAWSTAGPSVEFLLPVGSQVLGGSDTVLSAAARGGAGLAAFDFAYAPAGSSVWVDLSRPVPSSTGDASLGAGLGQAVWSALWKTSVLAAGTYTMRATATDTRGISAQSVRVIALGAVQPRGPPQTGFNLTATAAAGTVRLTWDGTGTSFEIERSVDGASGSFVSIATTTSHSFVDTRGVPGIAYAYRVVDAATAATSSTALASPLTPAADGTTSSDSMLNVVVPPAVADRVSLAVTPLATTPPVPADMRLVGSAYEIDATSFGSGASVHLLDQAATVTFTLPAGLSATDAARLTIYHWDSVLESWIAEPTVVDIANGRIVATVTHFSVFAMLNPIAFHAAEGQPAAGQVAFFTSSNPGATPGGFTATITWGDGTTSSGTVTADSGSGGGFDVTASHTYAEEGSYALIVAVADAAGASASATGAATVADAPIAASVASPSNATFVINAYNDLLHRAPDAPSLTSYVDSLVSGAITPDAVALTLNSSFEYRTLLVDSYYQELLGRTPTPLEAGALITALGTASDEQVLSSLAGGAEFFTRSGATNAAFLRQLYVDLLGRPIDPSAAASFGSALGGGTLTRQQVAFQVESSTEYRSNLVIAIYHVLLRRAPDASSLAAWVSVLALGVSDEAVMASLIGNTEYFGLPNRDAVAGVLSAQVVASFTDANPLPDIIDFSAFRDLVNPDGTPHHGTGSIVISEGAFFEAVDYYTFPVGGDYTSTTTVSDLGGSSAILGGAAHVLAATTTNLASSANSVTPGSAVTFTAVVTSADGTPVGNVAFEDGRYVLATVPLTAGTASFTTSAFDVGGHQITAVYADPISFAGSVSASILQVVQPGADLELVQSGPSSVPEGATASYSLTVTNNGPAAAQNVLLSDTVPAGMMDQLDQRRGGQLHGQLPGQPGERGDDDQQRGERELDHLRPQPGQQHDQREHGNSRS